MEYNVNLIFEDVINLINSNIDKINKLRFTNNMKSDNTPVTDADKYVESLIKTYLQNKITGLFFIGEETYNGEIIVDSPVAILDPIDGTENFCSGLKEWGVSLSLWNGKSHLGSMLYLPELNLRLLSGDKIKYLNSRIDAFSSNNIDKIIPNIKNESQCRIMGCSVYNIFNVIHGSYRSFTNPTGAYVWDIIAGLQLAIEHGCEVLVDDAPYDGVFLYPDRKYRIKIIRV